VNSRSEEEIDAKNIIKRTKIMRGIPEKLNEMERIGVDEAERTGVQKSSRRPGIQN